MIPVLLICMFTLLILGFPMFMSLLVAALAVLLFFFSQTDTMILSQQLINGISSSDC